MNRKAQSQTIITWIIILAVILLAYFILNKPVPVTDEEVAKCIGKNSVIYTQLGCHACENQEELFGENYPYLNIIDCVFTPDQCEGIEATPTWLIDGEKHRGVQTIEKLKELTGC